MELDSMDLYRPQSKKPSSFWISDEHHKLWDSKTNAGKFSQYPAISKLREIINKDESVPESDLELEKLFVSTPTMIIILVNCILL